MKPGDAAALAGLADIAVPSPVSWMPQTWGWAALAALLLVAAAWAEVRRRRRREANRYRREALAELSTVEARLRSDPSALAAIPPLLKRVALAAWPRSEVASLSGDAWVAFLRRQAPLADAAARLLDDAEYRVALAPADAEACVRAARAWIEEHRVSA